MLNRKELMQSISLVLVDQGYPLSDAQAQLSKLSTTELELHFARAINAGTLNSDGTLKKGPIQPTPTATWEDVERAKQELQRDRERAEEARLDRKLRWDAASAAQQELRTIRERDRLEPQDRNTFADAAKTLRSFSVNEANFNLIRQILGAGFSVYSIQQAISANALQLTAATQAESDEWQAEDVEAHNQRLLSATPTILRQAVRSESESRRVQTVLESQAEIDRVHQARDAARKYPPLPTERNGKPLNASYVKRADRTELRFLIQRYGESAVTARLRGQG